jgi:hypothetical protein
LASTKNQYEIAQESHDDTAQADRVVIVDASGSAVAGGATAAKQDMGNTSLASIDGKTPVLGQAAMASSEPVVIASNQSPVPVKTDQTTHGTTDLVAADLVKQNGVALASPQAPGDNFTGTVGPNVNVFEMVYTGVSNIWERRRGNTDASLLASAVRTTTTSSSDQTNATASGVMLILNVSANPGGAETLSLKIQAKDPVSGNYLDIADAGVLFTAASGTKALVIRPGIIAADQVSGVIGKSVVLPRNWRAVVTHSSSGSWTYSVGSSVLQQ